MANISLYKEWKRIVCGLGFFFFGFLCKPVSNHLSFKIYLVDFWKSQFVPKLRIWYICYPSPTKYLNFGSYTKTKSILYFCYFIIRYLQYIYIYIYIYWQYVSELKLYMTYREFKYRSFTQLDFESGICTCRCMTYTSTLSIYKGCVTSFILVNYVCV